MLNLRNGRESENRELKLRGNSRLLDLPSFIIIEILTRTPVMDILNCRCVCKNLCELISYPSFVKDFISRTPLLGILLRSDVKNYQFLKLLGDSRNVSFKYEESKLVNSSFISNRKSFSLQIIGCSNGLICIRNKFSIANSKFYITNPELEEVAVCSNPCNDGYSALREVYGFFSCRNPEEYNIFKITSRGAFLQSNRQEYYRKTEVWIMGVGSGKWRYVGDAPFLFCHVILNGRVHWIADHERKGPLKLHSFDITKEQARPVPAPPESSCENPGIEIGVLGVSLCILDASHSTHLDIWILIEYDVATSWTKCCIGITSIPASVPLVVHGNMILWSADLGTVFCYDPENGGFPRLMFLMVKTRRI